MRLFVAATYQILRYHVPDLDIFKDAYVTTNDPNGAMKIMSMLPRAEETYLVGDWVAESYWEEVHDQLAHRLMRSGDRLADCQRIP